MDSATGLVPTAALRQETADSGPFSALSSLAGLHEPLVALWAAASVPVSPHTGEPMEGLAAPEVADRVVRGWPGAKVQVSFRPDDPRPGVWVRRGFVRGLTESGVLELESAPSDEAVEGLRIVVDRLKSEERHAGRLAEAVLSAYRMGGGLCSLEIGEPGSAATVSFSALPRCLATGRTAPRRTPSLFSRRSAQGACPLCRGSGGTDGICPDCGGTGLREEAGWFRIDGTSFPDFLELEVVEAARIVASAAWDAIASGPCGELVDEIRRRLRTLEDLGLGYLPLARPAESLSQGEERRARLGALVGAPLAGLAYVLDEPTTGLHPKDLPPVHALLSSLRDQGASIVVVEHDLRSLARCDHAIETGPGPGDAGGRILYEGPPAGLRDADTPSGRWISGKGRPPARPGTLSKGRVILEGARGRNLKDVGLEIPLGVFTAVTGVSGAGKSSLVIDTLAPALRRKLSGAGEPLPCGPIRIEGTLDDVSVVDPSGDWVRSPRSIVATLSGMLDELRSLYASLPDSRMHGWNASRFSPNTKGGRCETCGGLGEERIELHLLPDAWVPCSRCGGARFEPHTLSVRWKGLSIAEVLGTELDSLRVLFSNHPRLGPLADRLCAAGLGHLSPGRRSDSLSGGEALRLRLASAVGGGRSRKMWILDEPSRGLHPVDTIRLGTVFDQLLDSGDTVVAITHDPLLASRSDHVVEMGPGPGREGGQVLFSGTPADLARSGHPSSESVAAELAA